MHYTNKKDIEFAPGIPEKKDPLYWKARYWVFNQGLLVLLYGDSLKVLYALGRRADIETLRGTMSNKDISKATGINEKHVSKYIHELKYFGIVQTERKGWKRYYTISKEPPKNIEHLKQCYLRKKPKKSNHQIGYLDNYQNGVSA